MPVQGLFRFRPTMPENTENKLTLWQRAKLATKVGRAILGTEIKGEPIFPRGADYGSLVSSLLGGRPTVTFAGSGIDYAGDIGPLWNSSLVMSVVNFVATLLTEAPPEVLEYDKKGEAQRIVEHPLPKLLESPNPYDTGDAVMMAFSMDWFIYGNVYWLKERDPNNYHQVIRLWPLPAYMVEPRWDRSDKTSFISYYRYTVDGVWRDYLPEDIVHFKRGRDPRNPRLGLGAFHSVLREIYGDNMAANFSAVVLKNWGVLPFVISPKKGVKVDEEEDGNPFAGLTAEQINAKAESIKQAFIEGTTGDKRGQPLVQTIPIDITKLGFNPQELDITALRRVPESRVASLTGIPANVLQFIVGLEYTNQRASYKESMTQAYEFVVKPIMMIAATTIRNSLLPEFGSPRGAKQYFQYDFTRVQALQEDRDKLYKRGTDALAKGGITLNMFRQSIGKPLEEVDVIYVPQGLMPMTPETLSLLAQNPAFLRRPGPTPLPGSEPETVPTPKKALTNGHRNGNHNHNGNGHHPPAPRQIEGAKSVEYDGMTLWRDPVGIELTISLKAIQDAFDTGEKKIENELSSLREKLIDAAIAGIILLSPADYHKLVLDPPEGSVEDLRDELQAVYDKGRELVLEELAAQGAANLGGIGTATEESALALDGLAEVSASRVINELQSRVVSSAAGLNVSGIEGEAFEESLREEVEAGSTGYVRTAALEADHAALGLGRIGEMEDRSDLIREYVQSCVLDQNSCDPCIADDGTTSANIEDLPGEPNPNCEGGALCRDVIIAVYDSEAQ